MRERVVAQLRNVAEELAQAVADGLGHDDAAGAAAEGLAARAEAGSAGIDSALSLLARPGEDGIKTRRIAILVADGVDGDAALAMHEALVAEGAVPRFVGVKLGQVHERERRAARGRDLDGDRAGRAVGRDGRAGRGGCRRDELADRGHALEFLKDQYRHCKPILLIGAARALLDAAGIPAKLPSGGADVGLLQFDAGKSDAAVPAFIAALTKHRNFERETDPPLV